MKNKIAVIGAGMVGSAIAQDLFNMGYDVTVIDINIKKLEVLWERCTFKTILADILGNTAELLSTFDFVVSAVPGWMGYKTLKAIIDTGISCVDISFFPEEIEESLKISAREKGLRVVVDCGVAPGLHNIILGHYSKHMDIFRYECLVGGLPKERKYPFQYKAPFSPIDVIEEYTRPARYVEDGRLVIKDALSESEMVNFSYNIGTLESFNTDGLRSLINTMDIPNMKEKTLRYPGHIDLIKALKAAGFFDNDNCIGWGSAIVKNNTMTARDFTNRILFKDWKLGEEEEEFTIMRMTICTIDTRITIEIYDEYNKETKTSSMARTTGYTATGMADFILKDKLDSPGLYYPEQVPESFHSIKKHLNARGIFLTTSTTQEK